MALTFKYKNFCECDGVPSTTADLPADCTLAVDVNTGIAYTWTGAAWELAGDEVFGIDDLSDGINSGGTLALGTNAGAADDLSTNYSTYLGYAAAQNANIRYSVGVGYNVLLNASGNQSTAIGYEALSNASGQGNVAVGRSSIVGVCTGNYNTAVGNYALTSNTSGSSNVAIGKNSLYANNDGASNTAIGADVLISNVSGDYNIGIGNGTLASASGNGNVALGWASGDAITTGNYNIVIGHNLDVTSATADYQLNIGNLIKGDMTSGSESLTFVGGQYNEVTTVNAATYDLLPNDYILHVTYTGTGAVTSLTLPTAQTVEGRTIIIKDAGLNSTTNPITVDTEGGQLIDGNADLTIQSDGASVTLYTDGSNWFII